MEPFVYPKAKHKRKLNPPKYHRYQSYKKFLRDEFENKCVYCRLPDGTKGVEAFCVDHYRPKSLFPEFECDYLNLFYSCNKCNYNKHDYWPITEELENKIFIPNPCDHIMMDHLKYNNIKIESKSKAGGFTIETLRLNEESIVEYRQYIIDAIKAFTNELQKLLSTKSKYEKQLKLSINLYKKKKLTNQFNIIMEIIHRCENHLLRLAGRI